MRATVLGAWSHGLKVFGSSLALAALAAAPASAGVGGAAGPTWPAVLAIGNPVSAYIDIVNASDGVNAVENVDVLLITFTPSCSAQTAGVCTTADPGVFTLTSIAVGDPSSSCKDTLFTLVGPTPGGIFTLSPNKPVHLGPADGSGGLANPRRCRILLGGVVSKLPVDSSPPNPPITTIQFARAVLRGAVSQAVGAASGQATVAITTINDMVISKDDGKSSIDVGGSTTYTVTVTNNGPSPANGAIVKDPVAAGLSKTAAECIGTTGGAVCPGTVTTALLEGAGVVIPTFPTASTVTFTVSANLTALNGTVKNSASVTAAVGSLNPGTSCTTLPDPNSRNFSGGVCTAGDLDEVSGADLYIGKTDATGTVNAGGSTTYTITVTNNGPSPVTGAILKDPAAGGLDKTAVACSATPGQCVAPAPTKAQLESVGGFALPLLNSGDTYQITVTATVTATSGQVTNTGSVTPPQGVVNLGTSCVDGGGILRSFANPTCSSSDTDNVTPVADLYIGKTDATATVNAGGSTTYTITVTNNGPSPVTGAILKDPAAGGLDKTAVACSATPGQCVAPAPTKAQLESVGGFALPLLNSGDTYQITVTATVTATSGQVTNTGSVTPPAGTSNPGTSCVDGGGILRSFANPTCSSSDTDNVTPVADLYIGKTDATGTVNAGGSTTYTITVTNNGPSPVTGAILKDPAAGGLDKTAVACSATPGQCVAPAPTKAQLESVGGFALPLLNSGDTYQITVTATVTATSGQVTNTGSVTPPAGTSNPGTSCVDGGGILRSFANPTCSSSDTDNVTPVADLYIGKTDATGTVNAGGSTTYTITVTNNGPSPVTGAILKDPAAGGLDKTAVACSATPGQCVAPAPTKAQLESVGGFALPLLNSGDTYQITVTATVTATSGQVTNTGSVTPPAGTSNPGTSCVDGGGILRSFANPTCSSSDTDNVTPVADLYIGKTDGVSSVNAGTSTTYTITVTNNGPSPVTGAILKDPAAGGLDKTAVACSATPGQCVAPAPTKAQLESVGGFALPLLNSGDTYQITVTATVTAGTGQVTNTASVTPPAGTSNPGTSCVDGGGILRSFANPTCSSSDTDNVATVIDLFVSKTDGTPSYIPGQTLVYTIVVANNGPSPAIGVGISDARPSQFTTWSWACGGTTGGADGCTAAGNVNPFTDTIDLPANSTLSYTVTAVVSSGALTDIVNTVTATPASGTNTGTGCVTSAGIIRSFNGGTGACSSTDTDVLGLGIGGGHFDFDIYYFDGGKYKNKKHVHQWDNKWNVTGVNTVLPSDTNFQLVKFLPAATQFKVLVANQYLNPAAFLAVGTGTTQESVKTYGGLAGPSTDATTVLAGLTTHAAPGTSYNADGSTVRLIINLPVTAFNSIDWWGDGIERAGAIPNQTGCVNGVNDNGSTDDVGPNGERFNGALTVTVIKADTPADALELNVPGEPKYGWRVKVTAAPNPFAAWVLGEYTVFWHHPNGECYNEAGWVPNPPLEVESGTPAARPSGTADPVGPLPPNPSIAP